MKLIGLTQRMDFVQAYNERRDALDQRWAKLFEMLGFIPLIFPNNEVLAQKLANKFTIDGIILTGGQDLVSYGGDAPNRDAVEKFLIGYSIDNKIPLLGVCRGMQMILDYFKIPLISTENHVRKTHEIEFQGKQLFVNSYHHLGVSQVSDEFSVLARSTDGNIEAVQHNRYPIYGILWHPERIEPFVEEDLKFMRSIFV